MNIEEAKNAIITNKEVISESIKSLFDEYKGKSESSMNDFGLKLNTIFSQFNIPINFKILVGDGNVDIHPADDQSKELVQFCQDNNIF